MGRPNDLSPRLNVGQRFDCGFKPDQCDILDCELKDQNDIKNIPMNFKLVIQKTTDIITAKINVLLDTY